MSVNEMSGIKNAIVKLIQIYFVYISTFWDNF